MSISCAHKPKSLSRKKLKPGRFCSSADSGCLSKKGSCPPKVGSVWGPRPYFFPPRPLSHLGIFFAEPLLSPEFWGFGAKL